MYLTFIVQVFCNKKFKVYHKYFTAGYAVLLNNSYQKILFTVVSVFFSIIKLHPFDHQFSVIEKNFYSFYIKLKVVTLQNLYFYKSYTLKKKVCFISIILN